MPGPLDEHVDAFVGGVGSELTALSGRDHTNECLVEARHLVSAILVADGRLTTGELNGWLDAIGARLDPPVIVGIAELRESDLLTMSAGWVNRPSTLFDLLVKADARDGTRRAHHYYDLALALAHATAALDLVPSPAEIAAIDRLRGTLLAALDSAGVGRPGRALPTHDIDVPTPAVAGVGDESGAHPAVTRPAARPVDEVLAELDALIGLDHVKTEVRRLTSLLRIQRLREEHGLPATDVSHHLVFTGNPGTGKTTVARLLSEVYHSLGIVSQGHLVETDRSDLVAGFVGQTAGRTRAVLESALGGTVLIDEAYALARGGENDFGREAIDTLVKYMEDHREDLAVVVAGYPAEMAELIGANPGLESRFARTIEFPDYTTDELVAIFELIADAKEYHLTGVARERLVEVIDAEPRDRGFGNGRFVRNLFEHAVAIHAMRLSANDDPTRDQLITLERDDIEPI